MERPPKLKVYPSSFRRRWVDPKYFAFCHFVADLEEEENSVKCGFVVTTTADIWFLQDTDAEKKPRNPYKKPVETGRHEIFRYRLRPVS